MPHPIRLERDTFVVNMNNAVAGWCTTAINNNLDAWAVRSDGVTVTDYGVATVMTNLPIIAAGAGVAYGIHIQAPEVTEGNDANVFSLYAVQAEAWCEDDNIRPFLFVGESPSSITSGSGGNVVTDVRLIGTPTGSALAGGNLSIEKVVAIKEVPGGEANICFGVAMLAGLVGGTAVGGFSNLCVRRLLGNKPQILDGTKL